MIKALLLDMDDTLIDTIGANQQAKKMMQRDVEKLFGDSIDSQVFANDYVSGIYREWTDQQRSRYIPIVEQYGEGAFRLQLLRDLLKNYEIHDASDASIQILQDDFDQNRLDALDFFPGILDFLIEVRGNVRLVVITNGPEFSQVPKIEAIQLENYVDHIIIGGQEPEQKPARSIFDKALHLANCDASEAIHIGDSLSSDIAGAKNSGIKSIWVQHQQAIDETNIKPDYIVKTAADFPSFFINLLS